MNIHPIQKLINKIIQVPVIILPKPDTPELTSTARYLYKRDIQRYTRNIQA